MPPHERKEPEVRREELLNVALDMFSERGYEGASVRDLAKAAGVTEGLLYHYFEGKRGLLEAVVERFLGHRDRMLDAADVDLPDAETLLPMIGSAIVGIMIGERGFRLMRLVLREATDLPEIGGRSFGENAAAGVHRVGGFFARMQVRGELRRNLDPHLLGRQFVGAIFAQIVLQRVLGLDKQEPFDFERFVRQSVDVLLNGARAQQDSPGAHTGKDGQR